MELDAAVKSASIIHCESWTPEWRKRVSTRSYGTRSMNLPRRTLGGPETAARKGAWDQGG